MTPQAFVAWLGPEADIAARASGVDRWTILAQWAVETGWGTSALCRNWHNLAGIRWYGRPAQSQQLGGTPGRAGTGFAGYPSFGAFVGDYAYVMRLAYYAAVRAAQTPEAAMLALGRSPWDAGHYQLGGVQGGSLLAAYRQMPKAPAPAPRPPARYHVVSAGESLWAIAQHYYGSGGMFGRIATANHIAAPYTIHIGQRLVIP